METDASSVEMPLRVAEAHEKKNLFRAHTLKTMQQSSMIKTKKTGSFRNVEIANVAENNFC